jgi:hypothetical protein
VSCGMPRAQLHDLYSNRDPSLTWLPYVPSISIWFQPCRAQSHSIISLTSCDLGSQLPHRALGLRSRRSYCRFFDSCASDGIGHCQICVVQLAQALCCHCKEQNLDTFELLQDFSDLKIAKCAYNRANMDPEELKERPKNI